LLKTTPPQIILPNPRFFSAESFQERLNYRHYEDLLLSYFMKFKWIRRSFYNMERFPPFFRVMFSKKGLGSKTGRILIWGKFRRVCLSLLPPLAHYLHRKYGLSGGCRSCGASCKLLFKCPHWNESSHLCSVYEDRPSICRLFPITPSDITDRNLVLPGESCGFVFQTAKSSKEQY